MEIYYVNNKNEKINLLSDEIAIQNIETLFARRWDYVSRNNRTFGGKIKRFYKGVMEKDFVISVVADDEEHFSNIFASIHDITEYDVSINQPGKLYVNDFYLSCYIISSEYAEYEDLMYMTDVNYTLVSEYPSWIKESIKKFDSSENMKLCLADFGFADYAELGRYSSDAYENIFINTGTNDMNIVIDMKGPVINPTVFIGDVEYAVSVNVDYGCMLHIDTLKKQCVIIDAEGKISNVYGNRDCDDIFAKVPQGAHPIRWNSEKDINVTAMSERGEPLWT